MKQPIRNIIGAGLFALIFSAAPLVVAVSTTNESNTGTDTTTNTTTTAEDDKIETDPALVKARLEKLKTSLKIALTNAEQARLKQRCKAAQTIAAKLNERFGTSVTTRTKAYENLVKHLTNIIAKLKAKGVDVSKLQQENVELQSKIATYKTDLASYKQALSDVKTIDCVADPAAFKAALQTARTAHDKLVNDAIAIKTYVKDTIKPTLEEIRKTLEAQESTNKKTEEAQ